MSEPPPTAAPDDGTLIRPPAAPPAASVPPSAEPASGADVPATAPPLAGTLVGQTSPHQPSAGGARPLPQGVVLRYRTLRAHARGGLGQVFVALDEELNREVALKEIQLRHADDGESRARFLQEAEITGSLEHPGIVPVYGMGCYPDGRPFYAMRFIHGGSYHDAIARFHQADRPGRDEGERTFALRHLLGHFIDACNAIAYAHNRGIIHRDIKPANVMIGHFGETLVVDWGLAKAVGRPEAHAAHEATPHPPLAVSGRSTATQDGAALGTPAFMSPEQAAGKLDELGPASDVYSLGATLYVLLTGQAPFVQTDLAALLQAVQQGDFAPPRQVKAVPAALEAICLKAMALHVRDRYASAGALADDVERWLADEPVSAYREPLAVRARRWARRHRTLVASSGAVLLAAVVALAVTTALVSREKAKTEQQRRMAEDNFQTALHAVDNMLTEAAEEQLAYEPRMEKKRRALLAQARTYYQKFLEHHADDPRLRREAALAHKRLGDVSRLLGEYEQAREAYAPAVALLERLVADDPGHRALLAETFCNLGEVWRLTSHPGEALQAYGSAMELQRRLSAESPDEPAHRRELARTQYNRGIVLYQKGDPEGAEKALGEAIDLDVQLSRQHPKDPVYRRDLARAYLNLGPVLRAARRPGEAEQSYARAIKLQTELVEADPQTPDYRHELGASRNSLGFLYTSTGRPDRARAEHQRAIDLFTRLTLDFPSVPKYREELARALNNLAITFARQRHWAEAEVAWQQALDVWEKLAAQNQEVPDYQGNRGMVLGNLGWLLLHENDPAELALAPWPAPAGAEAAVLAAGELAVRRQRCERACQRLTRAMALDRVALERNKAHPDFLRALRDQTQYLAEARLALGRHAAAAQAASELPAVFGNRGDDYITAAELLARCAAQAETDPALGDKDRRSLSDGYAGQAVALLGKGVKLGYKDLTRLERAAFGPLQQREDFRKLMKSLP